MDTERTYAWTVSGHVTSGSLQKYANDYRMANEVGEQIGGKLWNGKDFDLPLITQSDFDEDDWAYVTIRVRYDAEGNEDVAGYRVDGRA